MPATSRSANDDTTLSVTYEATFPWCLLKTDLHVAPSNSDIPQTNRGNPKPDEFAYGEEYGGCLDVVSEQVVQA